MYYVYILKSKKNNQTYIGSTNDLKRRLVEHNKGKEISTQRYMPWELLYYEAYKTEFLARIREKRLKYNGNALREVKKRIGLLSAKSKSGAGFTLIEVLVATFIITVGIGAAITLVNQTTAFTQVTTSRLVASYLAQEGLEIVKNIRDTNLLKIHKGVEGVNWHDGLTGCTAGCEGDYTSTALSSYADQKLKIDGGFYKYSASGTETSFKRKITITLDTDVLKVSAEVSWQERGRSHQVVAQENLYQWMQ